MQQTGTLRKRKRRTIAKVGGLGTIPYNDAYDNFDGASLFGIVQQKNTLEYSGRSFSSSNRNHTSLWFTARSLLEARRNTKSLAISRTRITRDPSYHLDYNPVEELSEDLRISLEDDANPTPTNPLRQRTSLPESLKYRKYLLDKCTMQRLKLIILLGAISGAFPWKWNSRTGRIDNWNPIFNNLWKVRWFIFTIQTFCITCYQFYSFYHSVSANTKTHRQLFQSSLSVLWYTWNMLYNVNMCIYKDTIREYVNTLLKFNEESVQKYVIHLNGYHDGGWYVIRVAILTSISQVFETVSIFLMIPFAPWFLFHFVFPKPWYWLIPGAMQEFCVTGQVITSYILIGWILVAHSNTMQFWLKEMHNGNDSDYTTDELRSPKTSIEMYKSLQVLNQCFNICMSPLAIPLIKFQLFAAIVVCGYVLIRSMNHIFLDEFPAIMSYPIGVLDTTSMSFILLSMCASIFDLGCSFIDSWSRTKHKDFRRILMSCPPLKIWVGRFYTLTISTTLTFFQITFGYITDAIITFP